MSNFVYSTLTADVFYPLYDDTPVGSRPRARRIKSGVLINGGSNVANKNFLTPKGVITQVSDDQLALLQSCVSFVRHAERGFLVVERKNKDIEKVTKNMKAKDSGAPLTPKDLEKDYREKKGSGSKSPVYEAVTLKE